MDIMWKYMDIMKLMTAMPIEIRQDLVADGAFASDSHCKIIGFPIGRDLDLRAFLSRILWLGTAIPVFIDSISALILPETHPSMELLARHCRRGTRRGQLQVHAPGSPDVNHTSSSSLYSVGKVFRLYFSGSNFCFYSQFWHLYRHYIATRAKFHPGKTQPEIPHRHIALHLLFSAYSYFRRIVNFRVACAHSWPITSNFFSVCSEMIFYYLCPKNNMTRDLYLLE